MTDPFFRNNHTPQGTEVPNSPEKQILADLQGLRQELENYLNSSPSNPPCFLTHKGIAQDPQLYKMALESGDTLSTPPETIKNNVNKVITPVITCLDRFIENYGK